MLGYGPQKIKFIAQASEICGEEAVLDADAARKAGASFAIGSPAALAELSKRLSAGALEDAKADLVDSHLSEDAIKWLASGRRGTSSNSIFTMLTGYDAMCGWSTDHPHDPSDFMRCRVLIESCPEFKSELHKMRALGHYWATIINNWDGLCAIMDEEAPRFRDGKGSAPKTYSKMQELFNQINQ